VAVGPRNRRRQPRRSIHWRSAARQPDEWPPWFPHLHLARAETSTLAYIRAYEALTRAKALGAPADLVASVDGEIQTLANLAPPPHLKGIATETINVGPFTIYRTETELPGCGATKGVTLWFAWPPIPVPIGC
jgi:hypothetical protein